MWGGYEGGRTQPPHLEVLKMVTKSHTMEGLEGLPLFILKKSKKYKRY
jgi:hypothetical protein